MNWRGVIFVGLVAGAVWQLSRQWELRPVHVGDGPIAPAGPVQTETTDTSPVVHGRWKLTARAHYDITARVLSREDYGFDSLSDLVPQDLALGWGPMSDTRVIRALQITQSARFYSWRPIEALPISRQEVIEHSANTHVIPADANIRSQLARLRVGQVVHLTGLLVDANRNDGAFIRTSLSRTDTGAGACEVMLVERVETH